jgi:hypothetical protein
LVLLLSKKSWPPYLMLSLFPICLLVVSGARSRLRIAAFALFSVVAVTEHSVWANRFAQFSSGAFHAALLEGNARAWLFLILEVLLLAGYAWLFLESVHRIVGSLEPAQSPVFGQPGAMGAIALTPP